MNHSTTPCPNHGLCQPKPIQRFITAAHTKLQRAVVAKQRLMMQCYFHNLVRIRDTQDNPTRCACAIMSILHESIEQAKAIINAGLLDPSSVVDEEEEDVQGAEPRAES